LKEKLQDIDVMTKFELGEKVRVISGVYEGVKGVVESVDEGTSLGRGAKLLIRPQDKEMRPFEVTPF
jgi:transcription antitermination factor NusG